jgi:mannosyltransferase
MSQAPAGQRGQGQAAPSPASGTVEPVPAGPASRRSGTSGRLTGYLPVVLVAVTMLVLGLWGLERQSFMGNDEVVTRWAALLPLHDLFHLLSHADAVHGFYYFLMHGWMAVGTSPAVMRVPSVIAMTIAVALVAIIARRLTGSGWAAVFAGLIMAFTPVITFYAQTARSYATVMAIVLAATLALLHALQGETTGASGRSIARRWIGYGALVVLGGYLNEMALLMLAAHGVTVLLARYGRRVLQHWFIAGAIGALLVTPLMLISAHEANMVGWIPSPHLWMLKVLFHDYFGPTDLAAGILFCCAVVALLPPIRRTSASPRSAASDPGGATGPADADRTAGSASKPETPELPWWRSGGVSVPSVAAPLLVLPGALLLLESLIARPLYVDRYVLYGEAGAALLAGWGIYRIGRWLSSIADNRLLVLPGVLVCALTLVLQLPNQHDIRTAGSRLYNFGAPSGYVARHAQAGDGVLYFPDFFRKAELGYPQDFGKVTDFSLAQSPALAGSFWGNDKPLAAVRRLMLGYRRIWVLGRPPTAVPRTGYVRGEQLWLQSHFSLVREVRYKGIVVSLWVRNQASS